MKECFWSEDFQDPTDNYDSIITKSDVRRFKEKWKVTCPVEALPNFHSFINPPTEVGLP